MRIDATLSNMHREFLKKPAKGRCPKGMFPHVEKTQKTFGEYLNDCLDADPELRREAIASIGAKRK